MGSLGSNARKEAVSIVGPQYRLFVGDPSCKRSVKDLRMDNGYIFGRDVSKIFNLSPFNSCLCCS